jgi:hypothetical protein
VEDEAVNDKKETKTDTKAAPAEKQTVKRATGTARAKKATPESAAPARAKTTKAAAALRLVEAPSGKAFWVNFGPIVNNLRGLRDALAHDITDQQFTHHVSGSRNDFAAWVEEVLCDASCATALRRAKTREAAVRAVETALKRYA